jgi:hypothetical protein
MLSRNKEKAACLSRTDDAEEPIPVLASRGQHFENINCCSDGERQLVIEESMEQTTCQHMFHQQLFITKLC